MAPPAEYQDQVISGSKNVPWYYTELSDVTPQARELLENYSHIPPEHVNGHILQMREKAWKIFPYPCIGRFRFLDLFISSHPAYERVLSLLKEPQSDSTLLDLGCCFAQDVRKLIYDGAPAKNLYASDLQPEFLELGYELFADRNTCKARFFAADVFQEGNQLNEVEGKIDAVYAASFLHLFSWDDQLKVCRRLVKILKPRKGSLVFGRQTGNVVAQETPNIAVQTKEKSLMWRHNEESFEKMWEVVGEETGTKWKTWVRLDEENIADNQDWRKREGRRRLTYEVERMQ